MALNNNLSSKKDLEKENCHSSEFLSAMLKELQEFQKSKLFCDVTLVAGTDDRRIHAHRNVLASSSAYFKAMFTSSLREAEENEVTLKEVSGDSLEKILQFCYSGSIELTEDSAETIFVAAHHLQFNIIVDTCVNFMVRQLDHCNCIGYFIFAEQYNSQKLLEEANSYICENYVKVCKGDEFLTLSAERLSSLLIRDDIKVPSEKVVCDSLLTWIKHDQENRLKDVPKLLPLIRLSLLHENYLEDFIKPLCNTYECQQLLIEALFSRSLPNKLRLHCSVNKTPRNLFDEYHILAVNIDASQTSLYMEIFSASKNKWTKWDQMPKHIKKVYGCVTFDNKVFLFGKNDHDESTIDCLDLLNVEWKQFQSERGIFPGCSVAVFQSNFYILGGLSDFSSDAVIRWDPNANNWSDMPSMTIARHDFSVVVMGDYIYVIGGCNMNQSSPYLNSVERFNKHGWTQRRSMQYNRSQPTAAVFCNSIYVFGGFDGKRLINEVERYDADHDTWTMVLSMADPRKGLGCVVFENKFFLIGGRRATQTKTSTNYVYDILHCTLARARYLLKPISYVAAVLIPNIIPKGK